MTLTAFSATVLAEARFFGENEAPPDMLAGNPDLFGKNEAPVGMLVGNLDFFWENEAPAAMLAGNPDFSWREIQSRRHSNTCLFGCGDNILNFWDREPTMSGIDIHI